MGNESGDNRVFGTQGWAYLLYRFISDRLAKPEITPQVSVTPFEDRMAELKRAKANEESRAINRRIHEENGILHNLDTLGLAAWDSLQASLASSCRFGSFCISFSSIGSGTPTKLGSSAVRFLDAPVNE